MSGTVAALAASAMSSFLYALNIIASQNLDTDFISSESDPKVKFVARQSKKIACPQSCVMPASKDILVRVDVFWKSIDKVFPESAFANFFGFFFTSIAF